jgi:hypothetical protein
MKQLSFIVGLFAVLISCKTPASVFVPYEVVPITAKTDTTSSTGVFYALPRQSVEVEILIRKQEFIKGPYAEFAERLLGVNNFIRENRTLYSIENVSVLQKSEMNPNQIYFVKFNDSKLALNYDNGLIISGVNLSENQFFETGENNFSTHTPQTQQTVARPIIPTFNLTERKDTVFFNQMIDTHLVQRYEIRTVQTVKTPFQKAEEVVAQITEIREFRNLWLKGFQEVNYEAGTMKFMTEEFNRLEDEYIRLFIGTTKVSYETARFEFLPTNKDRLTIELARFSTNYGLLNSTIEGTSDEKTLTLNIMLQDDIFSDIQKFSRNIRLPQKGFYYSIPSPALVTISVGNQILYSKEMPFSQFGTTQSLAPNPLQIDFSPQTGEIRSIRVLHTMQSQPNRKLSFSDKSL